LPAFEDGVAMRIDITKHGEVGSLSPVDLSSTGEKSRYGGSMSSADSSNSAGALPNTQTATDHRRYRRFGWRRGCHAAIAVGQVSLRLIAGADPTAMTMLKARVGMRNRRQRSPRTTNRKLKPFRFVYDAPARFDRQHYVDL